MMIPLGLAGKPLPSRRTVNAARSRLCRLTGNDRADIHLYDYPRKGPAMPSSDDLTRLTISWTKETDLELRTYLGSQGMKKGDLSKFIEDAVRWRLFDQTVTAIKVRNADIDPDALTDMIDTTVRDVRRNRTKQRETASKQH
jgi:Ribbon-helix-helix domain